MRNEIEYQDLGWAPMRYAMYTDTEPGEWRLVHDDDVPVAVVWTNNDASAGILWVRQTELVMKINKMLMTGAMTGVPAFQAYGAVESKFASSLGTENTGPLVGVTDAMLAMMREIDDASQPE